MTSVWLAALLTLPIGPQNPPSVPSPAPPSGKELLARVAATYANCKSYRDEGVAGLERDKGRSSYYEHVFTTAFVRGEGFRLEIGERSHSTDRGEVVIVERGGEVRSWKKREEAPQEPQPIETMLVGLLPTMLAGPPIPPLLFADRPFTDRWSDWTPESEPVAEEHDAVDCWRVDLKKDRSSVRAWIDRALFVLIGAEYSWMSGTETSPYVIHWTPQLDVPIAPTELGLTPPYEERYEEQSFTSSRWKESYRAIGFLIIGVCQWWRGLRLRTRKRPLLVRANWYAAPVLMLFLPTALPRLLETFRRGAPLFIWNEWPNWSVAAAVVLLLGFLLNRGSYVVVGITRVPLLDALTAVLDASGHAFKVDSDDVVLAATGGKISIGVNEISATVTLSARRSAERRLLSTLRPLLDASLQAECCAIPKTAGRWNLWIGSAFVAFAVLLVANDLGWW